MYDVHKSTPSNGSVQPYTYVRNMAVFLCACMHVHKPVCIHFVAAYNVFLRALLHVKFVRCTCQNLRDSCTDYTFEFQGTNYRKIRVVSH